MCLSAKERHKHRHALCQRLLHNCNPCEECNIHDVQMVRIRHHIPDAKQRKPDTAPASVIYNAARRRNKRYGIIAAAREVCNATRRLGDGLHLILRQRVQGSARAVRAVQNTQVSQTETRVVAEANESPARSDEPTKHYDVDNIRHSGVSAGHYKAPYGAWRFCAVR
jgi:hypothetical protein